MNAADPAQTTHSCSLNFSRGHPGTRDLVIAFAGVMGGLGGIDVPEFSKSLRAGAAERDVIFVRESPPAWYNSADENLIATLAAAGTGKRVLTLGNSMGGFAAILFALLLPGPCRSLSFVPQLSIHRDEVPFEPRWKSHAEAMAVWRYRTCLPAAQNRAKGAAHLLICGSGDPADIRHVERILEEAANPAMALIVDGSGHEVAQYLKAHDALVPLLDALMGETVSADAVASLLARRGVSFRLRGAWEALG